MSRSARKLLNDVERFAIEEYSVDDWNRAVRVSFAPFVRRKSILHEHRDLFRAELVNLAKVQALPGGARLLQVLTRSYREALYRDPANTIPFLIECYPATALAEERWITLALTYQPLERDFSLNDRVAQTFSLLEAALEGCYKPYIRIAAGISRWKRTGTFPKNSGRLELGNLLDEIPMGLGRRGEVLVRENVLGLPLNQWRNIAAHRSFTVKTRSTIEITYGRSLATVRRVSYAALRRVLTAVLDRLAVARMASTIVMIEFMPDLKSAGLPDVSVRLESWMVGLCHNLFIVGFRCLGYEGSKGTFTLRLQDRLAREPLESVIHASQVLDQLAGALEFDATRSNRYRSVAVEVSNTDGSLAGSALIRCDDVVAWSTGELTTEERLAKTSFEFADVKRLRRALESGAEPQKV